MRIDWSYQATKKCFGGGFDFQMKEVAFDLVSCLNFKFSRVLAKIRCTARMAEKPTLYLSRIRVLFFDIAIAVLTAIFRASVDPESKKVCQKLRNHVNDS